MNIPMQNSNYFLDGLVVSVNTERIKNGMNPLEWSLPLMALAAVKTRDMSMDDYPYMNESSSRPHISPRLGSPLDQARAADYRYYPLELAARGTDSVEATMNAWLKSPSHRVWITDPNFAKDLTHIGVGYYYNPASRYKHYWVLIMANQSQEYPKDREDPYERLPQLVHSPRRMRRKKSR